MCGCGQVIRAIALCVVIAVSCNLRKGRPERRVFYYALQAAQQHAAAVCRKAWHCTRARRRNRYDCLRQIFRQQRGRPHAQLADISGSVVSQIVLILKLLCVLAVVSVPIVQPLVKGVVFAEKKLCRRKKVHRLHDSLIGFV